MITDADVKKLKNSFKDTFVTKDDLKDLRSQLNDDIDGKLVIQKKEILEEVDNKLDMKLKKQKDEIVKDVAEYVVDTIVPMFDQRDAEISVIKKKLHLPPLTP